MCFSLSSEGKLRILRRWTSAQRSASSSACALAMSSSFLLWRISWYRSSVVAAWFSSKAKHPKKKTHYLSEQALKSTVCFIRAEISFNYLLLHRCVSSLPQSPVYQVTAALLLRSSLLSSPPACWAVRSFLCDAPHSVDESKNIW